mgnify:CR=1 FL=1
MKALKSLIADALAVNASDIHLTVGIPPVFRIDGQLAFQDCEALDDAATKKYAEELCTKEQLDTLYRDGEVDFAITVTGSTRIRLNVFYHDRHIALALRLLPLRIPSAAELELPEVIVRQSEKPRGLILVTGPTGSGKSTTLAALLDHVNSTSSRHIITLEAPIEYIHQQKSCIINQRDVGTDTMSFASGLRAALRQDPDVILVGEMRDLETISTAITAAETGHLVFATLHTKGAANTIDRIIDTFPAEQQPQIRIQLADVLACVVGQTLLPMRKGGRCAVFEIMIATNAIRSLIRQQKTYQISSTIQTSKKQGMILLDDALAELVVAGKISVETALSAANDPTIIREARR